MKKLLVNTVVNKPIQEVWRLFTEETHIINWNFAHESWACPKAANDVRIGGKFNYRMESKEGPEGFNFSGTYTNVVPLQTLQYQIDDGRTVSVFFKAQGDKVTEIVEEFEPEQENPLEMQEAGWQAIMDNFKKYAEQ